MTNPQEAAAHREKLDADPARILSVLPAILRRYSAAYPAVRMVLQEATSDVQFEELLQGRIDVVSPTELRPLSTIQQALEDVLNHNAHRRLVLVP